MRRPIELLEAMNISCGCVSMVQLQKDLRWGKRRLRIAVDALRNQRAIVAVTGDCFRISPSGKSILSAARAAAAAEAKAKEKRKRAKVRKPASAQALRSRIWRAIRAMGKFTILDVASMAGLPVEQEAPGFRKRVQVYVIDLARGGYLNRLPTKERGSKPGSTGLCRYLLLPNKNTGPQAPRVGAHGRIFDPNLQQVTWTRGAA